MPAAVRLNDLSTGHSGFPSKHNLESSSNVFVNGLGIHRVSDSWETHCDSTSCHGSMQAEGSPNVFANGLAIARVADSISCGDMNAEGSPNVFVN